MNIKSILGLIGRVIRYGFLSGIAILVLTLLCFWLEIRSDVTLPKPTGKFDVGRIAFHWVDSARTDSLSPQPYAKRELIAWIWYPATVTAADTVVDYDRAEWSRKVNYSSSWLFRTFFARDGSQVHAHAHVSPRPAGSPKPFPILLMRSGIGTRAVDYTTIAEELASHGYVVVGSDAPYSTFKVAFPDGRVIDKTYAGNPGEAPVASEQRDQVLNRLIGIWSADARFVLDQVERLNADSTGLFHGRLDTASVGIFGHSFGGATAAQFCHDDPRGKAGVDMDGAPYGSVVGQGFDKPFMFLLADHADENDPVSLRIKSDIRSIYSALPDSRVWIYLKGAQHFNFCDMALQREFVVMRVFGGTGSIGATHGMEVISTSLRIFFDQHLQGLNTSVHDLKGAYPELEVEDPLITQPLPGHVGR